MPKLVIAIPYYESDSGKRDVLKVCLKSLEGQGEIIVLAGKQDTLPKAWNMCLELGFGMGADFVVLSNDDIELQKGDLTMLCKEGEVLSPYVDGGLLKHFHMHMACIPKDVYEKVGEFDEEFNIYWADTDYAVRMVRMGVPVKLVPEVNVLHRHPARTLNSFPKELEEQDRIRFVQKWGETYIDPVVEIE